MDIQLIGMNHKTAPIELRERLAFTPAMLRSSLTHFNATHHQQAHLPGVSEGVILSTCNRLEVYALVQDRAVAREAIIDFLGQSFDVSPDLFTDHLYIHYNETAVRHLTRVACGLDSMVLGEPQILGQITEAYELALSQKSAGTVLSTLYRAAIHAGKRARTETGIGINPASVSSVAAAMASDLLGDLSQRQALLIGAGEMGAIAVRSLLRRGVSGVIVVNRTFKNAEQLANAWGGKAMTFQQLTESLTESDIVIASTGAPHTILNRDLLAPAMALRSDRPLFIIDIALPRNVDTNVTEIPNVHLCDLDDLQGQANNNIREREAEIPQVEAIIEEEADQFIGWLASLDVVSTITALRRQFEDLRQRELVRLFNRLDLDDRERELVATMSHRLVNKILHEPTVRLKQAAVSGDAPTYSTTVRELFALDAASARNGHHSDSPAALIPKKKQTLSEDR